MAYGYPLFPSRTSSHLPLNTESIPASYVTAVVKSSGTTKTFRGMPHQQKGLVLGPDLNV